MAKPSPPRRAAVNGQPFVETYRLSKSSDDMKKVLKSRIRTQGYIIPLPQRGPVSQSA